ncbi:MAG: Wzz/FepE/Etk N-terminal domain-containing protein, partial [Myxococcota bacterium]
MAIGTKTPRDHLDHILAFVRQTMRYWWVVAIISVIGAVLGVLAASVVKPKYISEARLLYNERISSTLLQGRDMVLRTQNLGMKYYELLMARPQLEKVIIELDLMPKVVKKDGVSVAVDELKKLIKFRIRGTGMFHIEYTSQDANEAHEVTKMLTNILIAEDARLREENTEATKKFLRDQKQKYKVELVERQKELYKFLADHPE